MPVPLDEFPLHQAPLSLAYPASSDRNFYDRAYFNAHDRTGDIFLISGYGIYPNLGVTDAFVTVGTGTRHVTARTSDALLADNDRLHPTVGPYRIEVVEPLQKLRIISDTAEYGVGCDITWTGSFPAIDEPSHVMRQGGRVILDAMRFAQVGTWEGTIHVEGRDITVTPDTWLGTRDRSWGIRPVGEAEPPGRGAAEGGDDFGLWWVYVPLRFDDFALVVIVQEDANGHRILNEARRVWPAASGRPPEQLGWPEVTIHYRPGTRESTGATLVLRERDGTPVTVEVESLGAVALNCGPGYGGDPDWSHGQWRGRGWVEGAVIDTADPAVAGRVTFGVVDHVARAAVDGTVGYGLYEHGTIGLHRPSGFTDFFSVAP